MELREALRQSKRYMAYRPSPVPDKIIVAYSVYTEDWYVTYIDSFKIKEYVLGYWLEDSRGRSDWEPI